MRLINLFFIPNMDGLKKMFLPDNLSFGLIIGVAFLAPIFFLPFTGMALDAGKTMLVAGLTFTSFIFWLIGRFIDGTIKVPKNWIIVGLFIVTLSFLLSSVFSPTLSVSMIGQGFETGTFAFIFVGTLLVLVSSLILDSREKIFRVYLALLASFVVVGIFQLIRLFMGPDILSLGLFDNILSNLVGKWNDLGVFIGLIVVLALAAIEILPISSLHKNILYVSLAISLFLLAVINFTFVWWILAAISVVLFVYANYMNKFGADNSGDQTNQSLAPKVPIAALGVMLISLLFAFTGDTLGASLASRFNATQIEVRPSWSATYDIAKETLKTSPVFGSGPNRFMNEWSLHKPEALNNTIFWATDFNAGVGIIPTFAVTTGVVGVLAWLFFFGVFLYRGFRSILSFGTGLVSQYLILSSFFASLYLWLFALLYVPNATVFALAFLMTGIFVAVLSNEGITGRFEFSLLGNPKIGFVSVLALIFLIISSFAGDYFFAKKTLAATYFQKAVSSFNAGGSIDASETMLSRTINLDRNDLYYRSLSQLSIVRINALLQDKSLSPDAAKTQFTAYMGNAIDSAKQAIDYDHTNYTNWMNLGGIYEAIVPLNVSGAYEESTKSYKEALNLAPKNPSINFALARLEIANKNTKAARNYLNQALAIKSNYTEALFLLSQIEASEGNIDEAISRADQASLLAPNDVGLFFQLGLLKYTNKDFAGAIIALERAISLTPDYANAMYFLGLSYDQTGRKADAIKIFTRIDELNPDNDEVKNILKNLENGKAALANIPPPAPEKKKAPPIEETSGSLDRP